MTVDAAIIGGGVSGLATAYGLMRLGHRVVVLERQARPGGNALSQRIGGFLMEHGPSSLNAASPAAVGLARSLGLDPLRRTLGAGVRYRYLVGDGALHRLSTHPLGFLASGYLSPGARLRLLAEVFVARGRRAGEETVFEFCSRRFGRQFADRVIDPLVGGLLAGDPRELSMRAAFPALIDMERDHGSVVLGVLRRRMAKGEMPGRRLFSWRDGVGTLPRALAARLGSAVRTGVPVRRIGRSRGGFRIEAGRAGAFEARAVVIATQPHVAGQLLEKVDAVAAGAAGEIAAPPLAVAFLGYRRSQVAHPLDGLGYLAPGAERRALTGALFCSTMFADRAPEGHVALAAYIGGARAPELAGLAPADLVELAREEFDDLLGARGEPVISRVRQWSRGLPQIAPGHDRRLTALLGLEQREPGLFLTGNYLAGPAVARCLAEAAAAAARVHRYLGRDAEETGVMGAAEGPGGVGAGQGGLGEGQGPGHADEAPAVGRQAGCLGRRGAA